MTLGHSCVRELKEIQIIIGGRSVSPRMRQHYLLHLSRIHLAPDIASLDFRDSPQEASGTFVFW